MQNSGPDGGHTKSLLQSPSDPFPGATEQPGDILVSVDYQNGGVNPVASVRVWIDPLNVDGMGHDTAWANLQSNKPFSFTGVFDSGTGAAPYGYAEIRPNSSSSTCLLWSVENTTSVVGDRKSTRLNSSHT